MASGARPLSVGGRRASPLRPALDDRSYHAGSCTVTYGPPDELLKGAVVADIVLDPLDRRLDLLSKERVCLVREPGLPGRRADIVREVGHRESEAPQ